MGLDMYLNCNHRELVEDVFAKRVEWGCESEGFDFHRRHGIICYWRKANMIHSWFVENVQYGEDDCKTYEVSLETLARLRDVCKEVLDGSKLVEGMVQNGTTFRDGKSEPIMEPGLVIEDSSTAEELLPTQSGLFFGSTGYDEWYYRDVEETFKTLGYILSKFEKDDEGNCPWDPTYGDTDWVVQFTYQASW